MPLGSLGKSGTESKLISGTLWASAGPDSSMASASSEYFIVDPPGGPAIAQSARDRCSLVVTRHLGRPGIPSNARCQLKPSNHVKRAHDASAQVGHSRR